MQFTIFAIMDYAWGIMPMKALSEPKSQRFSAMFSSRNVIVCFCIWVCNPFKLIFVYGRGLEFYILVMDIQWFQYHLLKRLAILHRIFLAILSKHSCPYMCRPISELYSLPFIYFPSIYANSLLSWLLKLYHVLKSGSISLPNLSFSKLFLASLEPLHYHVKFKISLWISTTKKPCWDLNRNCIESIEQPGEDWNLNNFESFNLWTKHISLFIYGKFSSADFIASNVHVFNIFCQIYS